MGKGKGKRKLPIELIENKQYRMVSFSKRRKGLMKKAEEFNSITGSSIAVIVLSQADRPYVFGSPSFDSVIHRFQQPHSVVVSPPEFLTGQGSTTASERENAAVYAIDAHSRTTTPVARDVVVDQGQGSTHVAAAEPWRAWVDDKLSACQSIDDLVLLKRCLSHLKDSVHSRIVDTYFN